MTLIRSSRTVTPKARRPAVLRCEALEARDLLTLGVGVTGPLGGGVLAQPPAPPARFASFSVADASHDDSPATVFSGGTLRVNYGVVDNSAVVAPLTGPGGGGGSTTPPSWSLDHVSIELWQGTTWFELGRFTSLSVVSGLVNLSGTPGLPGGAVSILARACFSDGSVRVSQSQSLQLKTEQLVTGDFKADTFYLGAYSGDGLVIHGRGGTDLLRLDGISTSDIASFNGAPFSAFTPTAGGQAIYQGLAVDSLRLTNGREIYFTGIERLEVLAPPKAKESSAAGGQLLAGGLPLVNQIFHLTATPADPKYADQWNLHVTDVPDAWRFTRGSSKVMLVSLDTGILTPGGGPGSVQDMTVSRLITDPTDDDNQDGAAWLGHGHMAVSVMSAEPNNGVGVTGINWDSKVYVTDVYHGVSLQQGIREALDYARANGLRVVFQGGVQGEYWLTDGGNQDALEALIRSYESNALFAVAAGNGGPGGGLNDPNYLTSVSGVAKLAATHGNVMSVGALRAPGVTYGDLANAWEVELAPYSNRGSNLTMVAPTDSWATDKFGTTTLFGGTSCANPNLAAMASLVWSANPALTSAQVRNILERTAMDLGDAGRDDTFGSGLVDAGTAVRRAVALARDYTLATLVPSLGAAMLTAGGSAATSGGVVTGRIGSAPAAPAAEVVRWSGSVPLDVADALVATPHVMAEVSPLPSPVTPNSQHGPDALAAANLLFTRWAEWHDSAAAKPGHTLFHAKPGAADDLRSDDLGHDRVSPAAWTGL